METSPLICRADQWNGFYMIGTSVMKELKLSFQIKIRVILCLIFNPFVANTPFLNPLKTLEIHKIF